MSGDAQKWRGRCEVSYTGTLPPPPGERGRTLEQPINSPFALAEVSPGQGATSL